MQGNKIPAVGPGVAVPAGARIVDLGDATPHADFTTVRDVGMQHLIHIVTLGGNVLQDNASTEHPTVGMQQGQIVVAPRRAAE